MPNRDATRYSGTEQTDWTPERSNLQAITTYAGKLEERDPELANELRTLHLRSTDMGQVSWLQKDSLSPEKLLHAFRDSSNHLDEAQMEHLARELVHTLTMPAREKVQELEGVHDHAARAEMDFNPENFNALMDRSAEALNKKLEDAEAYLKEGLRESLLGETERAAELEQYLKDRYLPSLTEITQRMNGQAEAMSSLPGDGPEYQEMSGNYERDLVRYENIAEIINEIGHYGAFEAGINEAREAQERAVSAMTDGKPAFSNDWDLNQEISTLHNERKETLLLAHMNAISDKLSNEAREFQVENPPGMIEIFDQPGYLDNFKEFASTLAKEDQAWLANTITWRVTGEEPGLHSPGRGYTFPESARVSSALKQAMKEID